MNYLRRILMGLAFGLLPLTLFSFGIAFSLQQTLGKPETVKHALDESGIYETAITDLINKSQQDVVSSTYGSQADQIPADQPEIKDAIQKAFPPQDLSKQVGEAIDSTYAWVRGDTPELSFSLDFSDAKPRLADNLAKYAQDRAATLPVCPANTPLNPDIDAFNATCRPSVVSPEAIGAQARAEIMANDVLNDSSISADEITNQRDPTIQNYIDQVPTAYDRLMWSVYLSGLLAVVFGLAGILLHTSKRQASKRVAVIVLTVGVLSTIAAWLSSFIVTKIVESVGKSSTTESFQLKLLDVVNILLSDFRNWWMGFGLIVAALAIAGLVVLRATKPKVTPGQLLSDIKATKARAPNVKNTKNTL
jgi:hypothetical protein